MAGCTNSQVLSCSSSLWTVAPSGRLVAFVNFRKIPVPTCFTQSQRDGPTLADALLPSTSIVFETSAVALAHLHAAREKVHSSGLELNGSNLDASGKSDKISTLCAQSRHYMQ